MSYLLTIPKSVNEIVFIGGITGIILLLKRKEKDLIPLVYVIVIMILWRLLYGIQSTRYFSGLIIPFSILSGYFVAYSLQCKQKRYSILLIIAIICVLFLWAKKSYDISSICCNLYSITECHNFFNKKGEYVLYTPAKDFTRSIGKDDYANMTEKYYDQKKREDVELFAKKNITLNYNVLFDIISDTNSSEEDIDKNNKQVSKVFSVFYQKNKRRKHDLYLVLPVPQCRVMTKDAIHDFDTGILKNGDLEIIDSPEASQKKLKSHIADYETYHEFDFDIRTPDGAYFYNAAKYTPFHPYYNCILEDPIDGNYSADIRIKEDRGYIFFYQKFGNGTYEYSAMIQGKRGSNVCLVYDAYHDKAWHVTPLTIFNIPDDQIYQVNVSFSIDAFSENDYFIVGAFVEHGDVIIDNFSLKEIH